MANGNGAPPEAAPPQLNVLAQYTKDLSFENPNAPASLAPQQQQPAINIQINVGANNLAENEFEVTLSIEGKVKHPQRLTLDALRKLPSQRVDVTYDFRRDHD